MLVPFSSIPILNPTSHHIAGGSELSHAMAFIRSHPSVLKDVMLFSVAGATGQLFIFETLEKFGSLTLVTITVTRKLFTMLLSLVVFNHRLTSGQWTGVTTVFAGIGIEAYVKRQDAKRKHEQQRQKLKPAKDGQHTPSSLLDGQVELNANGRLTPVHDKQRLKDI